MHAMGQEGQGGAPAPVPVGREQMQVKTGGGTFTPGQPFVPRRLVRNGPLQTVLARVRPQGIADHIPGEQPILFDAGPDATGFDTSRPVRLLGYFNRTTAPEPRGLVMLLHGWEGCSHSNYNLTSATALLQAGYHVVRLNLRDHGPGRHVDPHSLNRGPFLGVLIDEAAAATRRVAELAGGLPFFIAGASMGGNFALRLALVHRQAPFPNLQRVVAFSPALNPADSTREIDRRPGYLFYFRRRWLRSVLHKQELFPDAYDIRAVADYDSLYAMTDWLVRWMGWFDSADDYFRVYSVMADKLHDLTVPTTIITAADDAVIPVADFRALPDEPNLTVQIHPTGGHVGFVDIFPYRQYLPDMLLAELRNAA